MEKRFSNDNGELITSKCIDMKKKIQMLSSSEDLSQEKVMQIFESYDFSTLNSTDISERKLACIYSCFLLYLWQISVSRKDQLVQRNRKFKFPFIIKGSFIYISNEEGLIDPKIENRFLNSQLLKRDKVLFNYAVQSTKVNKMPIILAVCMMRVVDNLHNPKFLDCLPDPQTTLIFIFLEQGNLSPAKGNFNKMISTSKENSGVVNKLINQINENNLPTSKNPLKSCDPISRKLPSIDNLKELRSSNAQRENQVFTEEDLEGGSKREFKLSNTDLQSKLKRAKLKTSLITKKNPVLSKQTSILENSENPMKNSKQDNDSIDLGRIIEKSGTIYSPPNMSIATPSANRGFVIKQKERTTYSNDRIREPRAWSTSKDNLNAKVERHQMATRSGSRRPIHTLHNLEHSNEDTIRIGINNRDVDWGSRSPIRNAFSRQLEENLQKKKATLATIQNLTKISSISRSKYTSTEDGGSPSFFFRKRHI